MKISLGILLGSTYLSRRWNPSEIFAASEPGLWVDPSAVANLNWRRNLLTFTEQFDNAVWTKTGATVTANAAVAPDGTSTADRLVPTAGVTLPDTREEIVFTGASSFSVYAKADGYRYIYLNTIGRTPSASEGRVFFDLVGGTVGSASSGRFGTIEAVGNGWFRCTIFGTTHTSANTEVRIAVTNIENTQTMSPAANGTSGILIWGAQLEAGSTATSYQPITDLNTELRTLFPNATLFQDTAGTTPVTTPGQTVALALDRSKGLVLGPELETDAWSTPPAGVTYSNGTFAFDGVTSQSNVVFSTNTATIVVGRTYQVSFTIFANTTAQVGVDVGGVLGDAQNAPGTYTRLITATSTTGPQVRFRTTVGARTGSMGNISVKQLTGNHLTQATAASRPVYGIEPAGGRRNLLVRTEEFDNAAWTKFATGTLLRNQTDPVGTANSATTLVADNAGGSAQVYTQQTFSTTLGTSYTMSVYLKQGTQRYAAVNIFTGFTNSTLWFDLQSGTCGVISGSGATPTIVNVGNQWFRCTVSAAAILTTASATFRVAIADDNTDVNYITPRNGISSILIWGAQLELGTAATNYQRVTTAFDVTEAGRANTHYLQFDGTDDWMISPTVTPGTDKAQVFAGIRKLSDAARGMVLETGLGLQSGSIALQAPSSNGVANYGPLAGGTTLVGLNPTTFTAPITNVVSFTADISADSLVVRINGAQVAQSTNDQGTGNFLAYPLYIGRRGGTGLPFNGRIYQLVVRFGPNLDSEKLNLTELFVGTKTGFYKPIITGIPTWQ